MGEELTPQQKLAKIKEVAKPMKVEHINQDGRNLEITEFSNGTIRTEALHKDNPKFKSAEEIQREGNTTEQNAIADLQAQVAELTKLLASQENPDAAAKGKGKGRSDK